MNHKYGLSLIALVSVFLIPVSKVHADVPAPCMGYYQATLQASAQSSQTGGVSSQNGIALAQQQLTQCEQNYVSPDAQQSMYQASLNTNPIWGYVVGGSSTCGYYTIYDSNGTYDILKWIRGVFPDEKDFLYGNIYKQYGYNYLSDNGWDSNSVTALSGLTVYQAAADYASMCNPQPVYTSPIVPVKTYVNSAGITDMSPTYIRYSGSTAKCKDGTYSYSMNQSGTCSGHKGVSVWF